MRVSNIASRKRHCSKHCVVEDKLCFALFITYVRGTWHSSHTLAVRCRPLALFNYKLFNIFINHIDIISTPQVDTAEIKRMKNLEALVKALCFH